MPSFTIKSIKAMLLTGLITVFALAGCASTPSGALGWQTLLDGSNMSEFNPIGNANWRVSDGTVQADQGVGFLVSKQSFADFEMRVEFSFVLRVRFSPQNSATVCRRQKRSHRRVHFQKLRPGGLFKPSMPAFCEILKNWRKSSAETNPTRRIARG